MNEPPRIVGMRRQFHEPEVPAWRGRLAVVFLVTAIAQLIILAGHYAWLLELWLLHALR